MGERRGAVEERRGAMGGRVVEERVVGLEINTSNGKQKILFGCIYPHTKICGNVVSRQLICKEGDEIVGFHGVFCVSMVYICAMSDFILTKGNQKL